MKKRVLALLLTILSVVLLLCGCNADGDGGLETGVKIKESPDKHIWYIKDYVGKNCAAIGERSVTGDYRVDKYGTGYLDILFIAANGEFIDNGSDDVLKEYKVIGQNITPNSVLKYTFEVGEDGVEYDYVIDSQTYETIVLSVCKVNENAERITLTEIKPYPDRYKCYVMDYTGRNLANCGELSYKGDYLVEKYGEGYIKLVIVSEDGTFVDPSDKEQLKQYIVSGQNIEANTEINYTFKKDEDGKEYTHLVDTKNIEEIELHVRKR